MRYSRIEAGRTVDVVDMATYAPLPGWYTTDEAFLERIFSPELVAQWKAANCWFVAVCGGVQPGATYLGGDPMDPAQFVNPDGSDGNGVMPQIV